MVRDVEPPIGSERDMSGPSQYFRSLGPLTFRGAVTIEQIDGRLLRVADKQGVIGNRHSDGFLKVIRLDTTSPRRGYRFTQVALFAREKRTEGQENGGGKNQENVRSVSDHFYLALGFFFLGNTCTRVTLKSASVTVFFRKSVSGLTSFVQTTVRFISRSTST